jgi:hypothetical protein
MVLNVSCPRLFFLVLLSNQRWSPPVRLQASHCSTFCIMCDVPSIAVFRNESIECFPGTAFKFFRMLLVTIPVAPIIIIIIIMVWKIKISARYKFLLELTIQLLAGRPENMSCIFTMLLPSQHC